MNILPADLDVTNPIKLKEAERSQRLHDLGVDLGSFNIRIGGECKSSKVRLKQVDEAFNLASYWSNRYNSDAPKEVGFDNFKYFYPQFGILNQIQSLSDAGLLVNPLKDFMPVFQRFKQNIRAKKRDNELFDDLFFVEFHLASLSLSALILKNQMPWVVSNEMNLLTRILELNNEILNDPFASALVERAATLKDDIERHLNDYKNDPLVRGTQKVERWSKILEAMTLTCAILASLALIAGIVCLATSVFPCAGLPLLAGAIAFSIGGIINGVVGYYIETTHGRALSQHKESVLRTQERQIVLHRFFEATNELVGKDLPKTPTLPGASA